jgi:hypothetical protein
MAVGIRTPGAPRFPLHTKLLVAFVAVLVLFLSGVQGVLGRVPKQLVEVGLGALLLAAFLTHPVVSRSRRAVGVWASSLAMAWPAAVILVDAYRPRAPWLFPLDKWHMFIAPMGKAPDPEQFRYIAHFVGGGSARLIPGAGVSDVVSSALDGELRALITRSLRDPGNARLRSEAAAAVRGIARMQKAVGEDRAIRSVTVERCRFPVRSPYIPECANVLDVEGSSP